MQPLDVLKLLTDGRQHSGETLAKHLGVKRAAVRRQVAKLERWGLEVECVRGQGYRLSRSIDLLSARTIADALGASAAERLGRLDVFAELDSTNLYLLRAPAPAAGELTACLAEYQTAGRGRRGRRWQTPFGGGLCLSVGWLFDANPRELGALGLAAAVVARRVIGEMTGRCPSLKWPNDLVWADRKLGGVLVELSPLCPGTCHVVIGIGINVSVDVAWLQAVSDWQTGAVDLETMTGGCPPPRNALAGRLIDGLYGLVSTYGMGGFRAHHPEFEAANYLRGSHVAVTQGDRDFSGTVVSVAPDGALILRTASGTRRVLSGDVSVRAS